MEGECLLKESVKLIRIYRHPSSFTSKRNNFFCVSLRQCKSAEQDSMSED